jgi:hypothetical protein
VGAFAGGFLLIPALGVAGTITGAAFVYLAVGAAFGVGSPAWAPRPALMRAASVVAVGLTAATVLPAWNPAVMTSGIYEYVSALTEDFTREEFHRYTRGSWELIYYKDGPTSTVAVALQPERMGNLGGEEVPNLVYMTDGKADASSVGDMATQVMLAHAPLLLHPAPRTSWWWGWPAAPPRALCSPIPWCVASTWWRSSPPPWRRRASSTS